LVEYKDNKEKCYRIKPKRRNYKDESTKILHVSVLKPEEKKNQI